MTQVGHCAHLRFFFISSTVSDQEQATSDAGRFATCLLTVGYGEVEKKHKPSSNKCKATAFCESVLRKRENSLHSAEIVSNWKQGPLL